jgi:hypothetical protein
VCDTTRSYHEQLSRDEQTEQHASHRQGHGSACSEDQERKLRATQNKQTNNRSDWGNDPKIRNRIGPNGRSGPGEACA